MPSTKPARVGSGKGSGKSTNTTVVGVKLQVLITDDGSGHWFAQALEVDYAAAATSLEDVQVSFERGLMATIDEHLKLYGSMERFLVSPSEGALKEMLSHDQTWFNFRQVSRHQLMPRFPFASIEYLQRKAA